MFDKILIANRGEIACRVIRSCQKLGINTVAVYSDADRGALHVQMADEAIRLGPAPSAQSYLCIEAMVQACQQTGAEAVHPGYGFLSENRRFAEALGQANIVFIGPPGRAIEVMGDKISAKKRAREAGVATVPGYMGLIGDADQAVRIAADIGYPVMIKASGGGGGKGMRVAYNDDELREGFGQSKSEAASAFGDDRIFIEKFIEAPRHIEIQILADTHGNTLYLGERECSLQRRHQKVVEEAPSAFLDEATRKAMGEQACALARAVDYCSAGTVEFIVDQHRNFYFLEMNTRLQVEHPVTELITGQDLVEWMIRIAGGEKLSLKQQAVTLTGWAVETRIYAEDPFRSFLPATGRLIRCQMPQEKASVRVDTGVYEGGEITLFYDPMLAKLITYGATRKLAIHEMRKALDACYIRGISHNIPFLAAVMANKRFQDGNLSTHFIAEEYGDGFATENLTADDPGLLPAVAALLNYVETGRDFTIDGQLDPQHRTDMRREWVAVDGDAYLPVRIRVVGPGYAVTVKGDSYTISADWKIGNPLFTGAVNGAPVTVQIDKLPVGYRLAHNGVRRDIRILSPHVAAFDKLMPVRTAPDLSMYLLAPMPGLLVRIAVQEGQSVKSGEALCVLEAMKMENVLKAESDAVVKKIHAAVGDCLTVDAIIIEFEQAQTQLPNIVS